MAKRLGKRSGLRDFGGNGLGDILLGDRDADVGDGGLDHGDDAPALQAAERALAYDLDVNWEQYGNSVLNILHPEDAK